ncbi:PLU-1-like protein-domain-containing protein [Dipodascopsis uninucleata]
MLSKSFEARSYREPSSKSNSKVNRRISENRGGGGSRSRKQGIPSLNSNQNYLYPPLNMNSVEHTMDISKKPQPKKDRLFGLTEAPTYYPSEEDFKDPFKYISKIAIEGREYGIIKVVPPDSWRPQFSLDSKRFWFKSRKQELNSVEAGTRANLNFLDQLHKFHKQRGVIINKLPIVNRKPLDLYLLKKSVDRANGFDEVCRRKLWAEIGRGLGYKGKIMTSLSSSLKNAYQRYILPYDQYLATVKPVLQQQNAENGGPPTPIKRVRTPSASSVEILNSSSATPFILDKTEKTEYTSNDTISELSLNEELRPLNILFDEGSNKSSFPKKLTYQDDGKRSPDRQLKRLKMDNDSLQFSMIAGSNTALNRPMGMTNRMSDQNIKVKLPGENCEICGRGDDALSMLLCDDCDSGYHMYCLNPPLKSIPDYDWYCDKCLIGTGEYGFEDGQVYSLKQFQDKANRFKQEHFAHMKSSSITEDTIEKEFWRLVESVDETVEVEYGADIHSTIHGSGFPTIEKNPLDSYSTDPWNLNIMPLHEKSLFRHIKTDISGMTVPWLYVGMMFSTFCWHNEDHYTYSANYQHFGATKTWYGIPGADAEKFEAAMRNAVPELFEQQPDLLFQLVTMLSPKRLLEKNVRCYAIDQHPGEFVITFPKAYHAGFNQGFNFNEAVNFAPSDWEPFGKMGVDLYQDYRKLPVFSHDELLLTAAARDSSIETALWLGPALRSMKDRELELREYIRSTKPGIAESLLESTEEFQCAFCNAYCYLSHLSCDCTPNVACLNHYEELCDCDVHSRKLEFSFSDGDLQEIVAKVNSRAEQPRIWIEKLQKIISQAVKPSIKTLRSLLSESEKISYNIPEAIPLRKLVEEANEWIEEAQFILARKLQNRRKNEKAWRRGSSKISELEERDREHRQPDYIMKLLWQVDKMSFTAPEIDLLKERVVQMEDFRNRASILIENPSNDLNEYIELIETGNSMNIDFPELTKLNLRLQQLKWIEKVHDVQKKYLYLDEVNNLLVEGTKLGFDEQEPEFHKLLKAKVSGDIWERTVRMLKEDPRLDYDILEQKFDEAANISVLESTYDSLEKTLLKYREACESIAEILKYTAEASYEMRPKYRVAREVIDSIKDLATKPSSSPELEKYVKRLEDWMRKGKRYFGKVNAPLHILKHQLDSVKKRNEICFSMDDLPRSFLEGSSEIWKQHYTQELIANDSATKELFCLCRLPESGLMIECEICHEWYHSKCLKITRGKIKNYELYTCLVCDHRIQLPRDAVRPLLDNLVNWEVEGKNLPLRAEELDLIHSINDTAMKFKEFMRPLLAHRGNFVLGDVYYLKFFLRKLEGADICLAEEINFLRSEIHRLSPLTSEPPPRVEDILICRKYSRPPKLEFKDFHLSKTTGTDLNSVEERSEFGGDQAPKPYMNENQQSNNGITQFSKNSLPLLNDLVDVAIRQIPMGLANNHISNEYVSENGNSGKDHFSRTEKEQDSGITSMSTISTIPEALTTSGHSK